MDKFYSQELREWILSDPILDSGDHAIYYFRDNGHIGGPGPVQIIPNVVCNSLKVFRKAIEIASEKPGRHVAMIIYLECTGAHPGDEPRNRTELEGRLNVTPPELVIWDGDGPLIANPERSLVLKPLDGATLLEDLDFRLLGYDGFYEVELDNVPWQKEPEYQSSVWICETERFAQLAN